MQQGSQKFAIALIAAATLASGCARDRSAHAGDKANGAGENSPTDRKQKVSDDSPPPGGHSSDAPEGESCLGVADTGIFSDLDPAVQISLPANLDPSTTTAVVDEARSLAILYAGTWPIKAYPLTGDVALAVGGVTLMLRPADAAELSPLLSAGDATTGAAKADRDADGIPDPLDVLIGAHKTALNAAAYEGGYVSLDYPNGDVPRDVGVCTDVVVRAVRNAGLDIQADLQRDIRRSPKSYPMVKRSGDSNIDHRRVKTLLPYFERRWDARTAELDDAADPLRPGDIVFMDTFPERRGPDHIGIISDRIADSGRPYVINNWTDGTVTAEMDLLDWVPITHRFRLE